MRSAHGAAVRRRGAVHRRDGAPRDRQPLRRRPRRSAGYKVYTTIDGRLQAAANRALRIGLIDYTRRHGWRGAINKVELGGNEHPEELEALLDEYGADRRLLQPAVVVIGGARNRRDVYIKAMRHDADRLGGHVLGEAARQ